MQSGSGEKPVPSLFSSAWGTYPINRFFRWFWGPAKRENLPLSARVSSLEAELLSLRALMDKMFTTTKRLQGKVYRGVSLGETTDETPPEGEATPDAPPPPGNSHVPFSKTDLYARAAELRRR